MSRLRGTKKGKKINKKKKNNKISEALLDNIGPRYQRYATMEIMGSRGVQWTASGSDFIWGVERNRGGGKKKNDTNFRGVGRGRARERLLLDQGRCSAIEGEKCVSSSRGASCAPRVHLALFANRSWPASWWPGNCRKDRATLR